MILVILILVVVIGQTNTSTSLRLGLVLVIWFHYGRTSVIRYFGIDIVLVIKFRTV